MSKFMLGCRKSLKILLEDTKHLRRILMGYLG